MERENQVLKNQLVQELQAEQKEQLIRLLFLGMWRKAGYGYIMDKRSEKDCV